MATLLEQKNISTVQARRTPMNASGSGAAGSKGAGTSKKEVVSPKRSIVRRWVAAGLILGTAFFAVAFVANAIKVNELLASITSIEGERDGVRRENERLQAELLRLMSVEQVTNRATELGMIQPDLPPVALPLSATPDSKGQKEKSEAKREEE